MKANKDPINIDDYEEIEFDKYLSQQLKDKMVEKKNNSDDRLKIFVKSFRDYFEKNKYKELVGILIISQFKGATFSYIYNEQSYIYINLYATLESFSIDSIIKILSPTDTFKDSIRKMLQRMYLVDLAKFLLNENIINKSDYKFLEKLKNIRDSIAHKNLISLGKHFSPSAKIYSYEAEDIVNTKNPLYDIFKSVDIFMKIIHNISTNK